MITYTAVFLFLFTATFKRKNTDGRRTSSHDNREFRTRSMEKQRGMAFGFWKTVTAVIRNRMDR
jgi:hypothetical protein